MEWIEVDTVTGEETNKTLINLEAVANIEYHEKTDLTIITYIRSAYPSTYIRGDITRDIKRLLSSHDNYVSRIGG